MAGSILKIAFAVVFAFQTWAVQGTQRRQNRKTHWVDLWGSMPQLVEYTNMPPPPFVSFFALGIMLQAYFRQSELQRTQS